jgi:hypothetical protein
LFLYSLFQAWLASMVKVVYNFKQVEDTFLLTTDNSISHLSTIPIVTTNHCINVLAIMMDR